MKCPKCQATDGLKGFLRHQDTKDSKENEANTITILCTTCGFNESYLLIDCLEDIFPSGREVDIIHELSAALNKNFQNNFDFKNIEEKTTEEE